MTIKDIERLTGEYGAARGLLAEEVGGLNAEIDAIKKARLPRIKRLLQKAAERKAELKEAIIANPDIFERPRTFIFANIRIGFKKARGKIEIGDEDLVVRLIKRHFPEQADILIKCTETPVKKALEQLSASELKKLGVEVWEAGNEVVIKPMDSEIEKLVAALLRGVEEKEKEVS